MSPTPERQTLTPEHPLWDDWVRYKAGDFCTEDDFDVLRARVFPLEYGSWDTTEADKYAEALAAKLEAQRTGNCDVCRVLG